MGRYLVLFDSRPRQINILPEERVGSVWHQALWCHYTQSTIRHVTSRMEIVRCTSWERRLEIQCSSSNNKGVGCCCCCCLPWCLTLPLDAENSQTGTRFVCGGHVYQGNYVQNAMKILTFPRHPGFVTHFFCPAPCLSRPVAEYSPRSCSGNEVADKESLTETRWFPRTVGQTLKYLQEYLSTVLVSFSAHLDGGIREVSLNPLRTLILLVANLANKKWCKKPENDWNLGTCVLIWEYSTRAV